MANVLKVQEQHTITSLAAAGWSIRRIARTLGVDRKSVRRYLRGTGPVATSEEPSKSSTISTPGSGEDPPPKSPPISTPGPGTLESAVPVAANRSEIDGAEPGRPGLCEPHAALIAAKLDLGLTAKRIHQDLIAEVGFQGGYQSVKRFVRRLRHAQPQRVWRVEVEPGEEAQADFGRGPWIVDPQNGTRRRPWVLRVVLSYSRKAYSEAFFRQETESFVRGVENALRALGGSPRTLRLDNLKAAVLKADWLDPELNPKLAAFARHYGVAVLPCRPQTPEHNGKTERGIGYLKSNALAGRSFPSLAALNEHLRQWESQIADQRIHGTTRQQVAVRFAEEQPALKALPPTLFPMFHEARRTVHRDGYVEVARAFYAVPPEYLTHTLWVRWDTREVRVFNQRWEQIALHRRLEPGQFSQCLGLGGGQGPLQRQIEYWRGRAAALGEPCGQWASEVLEQKGPAGLRTVIGLIGLADTHPFKALNDACALAVQRGTWRLRDVGALLKSRQPEQLPLRFLDHHPLIRNLAEYGLFIQSHA